MIYMSFTNEGSAKVSSTRQALVFFVSTTFSNVANSRHSLRQASAKIISPGFHVNSEKVATNRLESQQRNPYCWSKTRRHCINSLSKVKKVDQIATQTPLIHNVARAFNACSNLERDCDWRTPALRFPTPLVRNWSRRQPTRFCQGVFILPLLPAI